MSNDNSPDLQRQTFAPGEKVWVHDVRFPHSLRRATVVRVESPDGSGGGGFTVETGLGGGMRAESAQMHHLSDQPPVAGCTHCAADPNAAKARKG